jgi:dCMP deaminase
MYKVFKVEPFVVNTAGYNIRDVKLVNYNNFTDKELKWYTTFLEIARIMGNNSHCVSHKVGAVLVKNNRIISTGINGTPPGCVNCDEVFDPSNFDREDHHKWSELNELHAEINMLAIAAREGISTKDSVVYTTISPCVHCAKALVAAGVQTVVFSELYDLDIEGLLLILLSGVSVFLIKEDDASA